MPTNYPTGLDTLTNPSAIDTLDTVAVLHSDQHANTNDMIYDVETIVSYVSQNVTLFPGDIILTGSPAGISRMDHGDSVECEIEGIGVLRNQVA